MAYQANIPLPTDRLKDSQSDILDNFTAIKQLIDRNHGTFGATTEGRHTFIEFPTTTPTKDTLTTPEVALYSKNGAFSGVPELFFQGNNLAADFGYAITESLQAVNGWTRLPSGIVLKWGTTSIASRNSLETITFPVLGTIPAFTAIFTVLAIETFSAGPSLGNLNTAVSVGNFTTVNFQIYARAIGLPGGGPAVPITYIAIGI